MFLLLNKNNINNKEDTEITAHSKFCNIYGTIYVETVQFCILFDVFCLLFIATPVVSHFEHGFSMERNHIF